ncbi:MarR family transcriptional regulator [Bradyrhizobium rifense]|uniref:MarR family transcriptional regulator n=1 Tax=Bradyrhizobium rifense TaxID=515499 RepID=A0A5D3KCB9_9BRAD|nr:MarR family transcriptional regulator [Bradyrhizobium rifense]
MKQAISQRRLAQPAVPVVHPGPPGDRGPAALDWAIRPVAQADIQRHFRVSPPSVHQMIVTLERNGFIRRQPGVPRSIEILLPPENLPILEWLGIKTSKSL